MSNKFIFSIILFITGTIGSGLFLIANSLERQNSNPQIVCGIIGFIFLLIAVVGLCLLINEITNNKNNK